MRISLRLLTTLVLFSAVLRGADKPEIHHVLLDDLGDSDLGAKELKPD